MQDQLRAVRAIGISPTPSLLRFLLTPLFCSVFFLGQKPFLSEEQRVDYVQVDEQKTQALQSTKQEWTDERQSKVWWAQGSQSLAWFNFAHFNPESFILPLQQWNMEDSGSGEGELACEGTTIKEQNVCWLERNMSTGLFLEDWSEACQNGTFSILPRPCQKHPWYDFIPEFGPLQTLNGIKA